MNKGDTEIRVEHATEGGRRGPSRRLVKMPGEARHQAMADSAALIARRLQLAKIERRTKRG